MHYVTFHPLHACREAASSCYYVACSHMHDHDLDRVNIGVCLTAAGLGNWLCAASYGRQR